MTIGILGGGQLARMTAYAAFRLGMRVHVFENHPDSPAGQIAHKQIVGTVDDHPALLAFASECDVVTLESEFVNEDHLRVISDAGHRLFPSADSVALIQDKLLQKQTFSGAGIPVAPFAAADSVDMAAEFGALHGYPFLLKRRRGSYDGYGNATVESLAGLRDAWSRLTPNGADAAGEMYCEGFVRFAGELAVMIARGAGGQIAEYPVVDTVQKNHICHMVTAPAAIPDTVRLLALDQAHRAVLAIDGVGMFGIELFYTAEGHVMLNEIAPRPHNTGHYTIEGCVTSQFENHLRAVLGMPLGSTALRAPAAVMVNILGRSDTQSGRVANYPQVLRHPDVHLHIYGKGQSRRGRKMGHITVLGATPDAALQAAAEAGAALEFEDL